MKDEPRMRPTWPPLRLSIRLRAVTFKTQTTAIA
jgi:hypothetical protein